jgi:hypothetical protein
LTPEEKVVYDRVLRGGCGDFGDWSSIETNAEAMMAIYADPRWGGRHK